METNPRFYLPQLDGLRFIAFLLVFIHNAPYVQSNKVWESIRQHSWIGVDIFFCLSGYLITKLLVDEYTATGEINVPKFFTRRALRIVPLYLLIICLAAGYTIYHRGFLSSVLLRVFGLVTLTDNAFTALHGYTILGFAFHLWTISYEAQFYAVIPFALSKLLSYPFRRQIIILSLLYGFGNLIRSVFVYFDISATAIYVLPITHFDSLLGGVMLGLWKPKQAGASLSILAGTGLFFFTYFLPNKDLTGRHLLLVYPLVGIGSTLVVNAVANSKTFLGKNLLDIPVIINLGKVSYGLYIYHVVCIYLAVGTSLLLPFFNHTNQGVIFIFLFSLLLTCVISNISYKYYENYFLTIKSKQSVLKS
jgi:peptidoglycan/LPS O-acetylase OafA/YrhL